MVRTGSGITGYPRGPKSKYIGLPGIIWKGSGICMVRTGSGIKEYTSGPKSKYIGLPGRICNGSGICMMRTGSGITGYPREHKYMDDFINFSNLRLSFRPNNIFTYFFFYIFLSNI